MFKLMDKKIITLYNEFVCLTGPMLHSEVLVNTSGQVLFSKPYHPLHPYSLYVGSKGSGKTK